MEKSDIKTLLELSAEAYHDHQVPRDNVRLVTVDDKSIGVTYFMRFTDSLMIIVFRGSDDGKDVLTNLNFCKQVPPYNNYSSKIRVHSGFLNVYKNENVRDNILQNITPEIKKIQITGHSLGAALAILCAVDIQYNFPDIDCEAIVYGCPRVGNKAFATSYNRRVFKTLRVKNGGDIITMLPPAMFGYSHVGANIKIGRRVPVSAADHHVYGYYSAFWQSEFCLDSSPAWFHKL